MSDHPSRRAFLNSLGLGTTALYVQGCSTGMEVIAGFEEEAVDPESASRWKPTSTRKVRVGIVGYGYCRFGSKFGFQDHPNVEVVAVSDLIPGRCAELARQCRCKTTYPSLEELVKDDRVEAVFVATDAPSHARHCIEVLRHGKHVASAVPAVFGSLEEADQLLETVQTSGRKYMMFETSCFHADCYAMRVIYKAGGFGRITFSEGEYFHYTAKPIPSYKNWRVGLPPLWYPTHSTAYYIGVTDQWYTSVSCTGSTGKFPEYRPKGNAYDNPFSDEIALLKTSEGGTSRMLKCRSTFKKGGESGRVFGEKGWMAGTRYYGSMKKLPDLRRPPLPPGVRPGGHGGSHGPLMNEFVLSILEDRKPLVDIAQALNMTVPGIVAHQSALRDGERMAVPHYKA